MRIQQLSNASEPSQLPALLTGAIVPLQGHLASLSAALPPPLSARPRAVSSVGFTATWVVAQRGDLLYLDKNATGTLKCSVAKLRAVVQPPQLSAPLSKKREKDDVAFRTHQALWVLLNIFPELCP